MRCGSSLYGAYMHPFVDEGLSAPDECHGRYGRVFLLNEQEVYRLAFELFSRAMTATQLEGGLEKYAFGGEEMKLTSDTILEKLAWGGDDIPELVQDLAKASFRAAKIFLKMREEERNEGSKFLGLSVRDK